MKQQKNQKIDKKKKSVLPPVLRIGKKGVTESFIEEIREQLDKRGWVKIKLQRGMEPQEREDLAESLAQKAGASLVDRRGNTAVLEKR